MIIFYVHMKNFIDSLYPPSFASLLIHMCVKIHSERKYSGQLDTGT